MSDSADSEIQFNMNANRPIEPVDDDVDMQRQMVPDAETDDDAMPFADPEGVVQGQDDEADRQDDQFEEAVEDNPNDEPKRPVYRAPVGDKRPRPRRNHGDGDRHLDDDVEVPVINHARGRPRRRLAGRPRPGRNDESEDSEAEANMHGDRRLPKRRNVAYYDQHEDVEDLDDIRVNRTRRSLPVIKPETYDGNSDWESYFSHFTNCADLGRWTDEEKALTLASCLSGPARVFYLGLREPDRKIYRSLVKKLNERFGSKKQQTGYITKFESRRRNTGEAVASFGDDLRLTAQRVYPELDAMAQESLALHQFYKTPEMKCRCIDRDCKTVGQAVEIVERYESIQGSDEKKKSTVRTVSSISNARKEDNAKSDVAKDVDLMKQMQEVLAKLEKMECKLEGRKASRGEGARRVGTGRGYSGCYLCKSYDHNARDCPSRAGGQGYAPN